MNIWLVEDEALLRRALAARLQCEPGWTVAEFENGAELLAALEETAPDLIVMDVEMPVMDGLDACRALRQNGHDGVRVVFVSGNADPALREAAYGAGGDDFLVKPFAADELVGKARAAERAARYLAGVADATAAARQTAMEAMAALAETGAVAQFIRASFAAAGPAQVAAAVFDALREYGLEGLVEFRLAAAAERHASRGGPCTPADEAVLANMGRMERLFQFRDRLAINYPHVTLVVHGIDAEASARAGRLRDQLALLAEACDARLGAMETGLRKVARDEGIAHAVAAIARAIEEVERTQAELRARASQIDADYLEDMVRAFVALGLSESQEDALAGLAERAHTRFGELRDYDSNIGDHLREMAHRLARVAED